MKSRHPNEESNSFPAPRRADQVRWPGKWAAVLALAAWFALTCPPAAFARAGGGGNGHGGGILYLILLPILLIYAWYVNRRINEKKRLTEAALSHMAAKDPVWDEKRLEAFVKDDFFRIERAWCAKDYPTLAARLEAGLYDKWKQELEGMTARGETNVLDDLELRQVRFVEAKDYRNNDRDEFTVCLDAHATDYTVNEAGHIVNSNAASRRARNARKKQACSFREFWTYHRHGKDWRLAAIDQSSAWRESVDAPIVEEGAQ